jgi:hypothetical protein
MFFLGTSGILIMWNREFIARPSEVVIAKEGLVLSFRYGRKQRKVSWDEVLGAKGFVEENGGVFRRLDGEGALALVDRLYYVNYPISRSINETYFKNRGLRLLEWKKGEDFKDFKKRATIKKS